MYLTTSIPYVNAAPHIGHALEFVQTDVLARYYRLMGQDVILQTGTDENAFKNVLAARKLGVTTQDLVDQNASVFRNLIDTLDVQYDTFIRTTESRHHQTVNELWRALDPKDLYIKEYVGRYCDGCEDFYQEKDLDRGLCPDHGTPPRNVKEENIFFRLSTYAEHLRKLLESGELQITPAKRKSEILAFIDRGLQDISISRSAERAGGESQFQKNQTKLFMFGLMLWLIIYPGNEIKILGMKIIEKYMLLARIFGNFMPFTGQLYYYLRNFHYPMN